MHSQLILIDDRRGFLEGVLHGSSMRVECHEVPLVMFMNDLLINSRRGIVGGLFEMDNRGHRSCTISCLDFHTIVMKLSIITLFSGPLYPQPRPSSFVVMSA